MAVKKVRYQTASWERTETNHKANSPLNVRTQAGPEKKETDKTNKVIMKRHIETKHTKGIIKPFCPSVSPGLPCEWGRDPRKCTKP